MDSKSMGIIAHSRAPNSAIAPAPRSTQAHAQWAQSLFVRRANPSDDKPSAVYCPKFFARRVEIFRTSLPRHWKLSLNRRGALIAIFNQGV
jgi:hypothetical protein